MQRFCRPHVLSLWCCAALVIFSYVLFDQLDIDGSNFDLMLGSCTAAERLACEDGPKHVAFVLSAAWPPAQHDPWTAIVAVSPLATRLPHPVRLHRRARAGPFPQGVAPSLSDSDPASLA